MRKYLLFTFLLGIALSLTFFVSAGRADTFTDNFDTGINTFYWTTNLENSSSSVAWDSTNKRVVMTQASGYSGDSRGANLVFNYNVTGDFVSSVDFTLLNWPTANLERLGIRTTWGAVERISENRVFDGKTGELYTTDFSGNITTTSASGDAGKLQFQRASGILTGSYWTGSSWQAIGSYNVGGSTGIIELSIWPWTPTEGVQVAFDNFYLSSPDTEIPTQGVPEPATMLLLGFGIAGLAGARRFKN